jgi:hypothetical protein
LRRATISGGVPRGREHADPGGKGEILQPGFGAGRDVREGGAAVLPGGQDATQLVGLQEGRHTLAPVEHRR